MFSQTAYSPADEFKLFKGAHFHARRLYVQDDRANLIRNIGVYPFRRLQIHIFGFNTKLKFWAWLHAMGAGRAMHAALLAGYRVAAGTPVDGLVMFGEPRSGGPKLSQILAQTPVQSFRNARPANPPGSPVPHDVVTDVARNLPPDLPYQHVRDPLTDCYHEPRWDDPWLLLKWHHGGHYVRAFGCGGPAALSLPT